MVKQVFKSIYHLMVGLITTGKHFGRKAVTIHYPEEKWTMPERSRGIVVLLSDKETGKLNCTACMLCQRSCPVGAINIDEHRDPETKKKILDDFVVDHTICCFCGMCEEACNFYAIKLATYYENSTYNKEELIEHKDKLQEMGINVPYVKPPKKKKPAPKKPASPKTDDKPVEKPAPTSEVKEEKQADPADKKPAKPADEKQAKPAEDDNKAEDKE